MTFIGEWQFFTAYSEGDLVLSGTGLYSVVFGSGGGTSGATAPAGTCGTFGPYVDPGCTSVSDGGVPWAYNGPADAPEWQTSVFYGVDEFSQNDGNVYRQALIPGGFSGPTAPTGTCNDTNPECGFPFSSDGNLFWSYVAPSIPVPEPTAFLLLFVGLIALAFAGRKNRKALKRVAVSAEEGYRDYEEKYKI